MKDLTRKILKKILSKLTIKAYKKHDLDVILVTGWAGSSIVREMIYLFLKTKYNVRRNTTEVWWDFSVPLNILGYEDKKRNVFGWVALVLRAFLSLSIKPKHHHKLIINLDSSVEDTARFWTSAVKPNKIVVLKEKPESKLLSKLLERKAFEKSIFIFNKEWMGRTLDIAAETFTFGSKSSDLIYKRKGMTLELSYKDEEVKIRIPEKSKFIWEFIPAAVSVGVLSEIPLKELGLSLETFSYHPTQLTRAVSNLKEFVHNDE